MHLWGRTIEDLSRLRYRRLVEDGIRRATLWGTPRQNRAARHRYPDVIRRFSGWRRPRG